MRRRFERIEESIARYLSQLETADLRGEPVPEAKVTRLKDKLSGLPPIADMEQTSRHVAASPKLDVAGGEVRGSGRGRAGRA